MARNNTLEIRRGDTYESDIEVTNDQGVAIDITGYTLQFMIKRSVDDDDGAALISKTETSFTDPTNGKTTFAVLASETAALPIGTFVYAYQLIDGNGNVAESESGQCDVIADVIRGTA